MLLVIGEGNLEGGIILGMRYGKYLYGDIW